MTITPEVVGEGTYEFGNDEGEGVAVLGVEGGNRGELVVGGEAYVADGVVANHFSCGGGRLDVL